MEERGNAQLILISFHFLKCWIRYHCVQQQSRSTFTMTFDHYSAVPKSVQEDIIKKNKLQ